MAKYTKKEANEEVAFAEAEPEAITDVVVEDNKAAKKAFKSMKAKLLAMKNQPGSYFDFTEDIETLEEFLK